MEKRENEKLPPAIADLAAQGPDRAPVSIHLRRLLDALGHAIAHIDAAANTGDLAAVRLTIRMAATHHDIVMACADGRWEDAERALAEAGRLAA